MIRPALRISRRLTRLALLCVVPVLVAVSIASEPPEFRITDSSGDPIPGADTRMEGSYLTATAPGFLPWTGVLRPDASGVMRIVLLRPALLHGRLRSDVEEVRAARIRLEPAEATREPAVTGGPAAAGIPAGGKGAPREPILPGSDSYAIGDLPPGLYRLTVEADRFIPLERSISLREGELRRLDLDLLAAAWLEARSLGPKGKPLAGVEAGVVTGGDDGRFLTAEETDRLAELEAQSDGSGLLVLGPLARDTRQRIFFRVRAGGYAAASIVLAPQEKRIKRDIRLRPGGTVTLLLTDPDDAPVAGTVTALDSDDAPDLDLAPEPHPSGEDGVLIASDLPGGTYTLRLRAPGFQPLTLRGVEVAAGEVSDLGRIPLEPGLDVAGVVGAGTGKLVARASVAARFYEERRRLEGVVTVRVIDALSGNTIESTCIAARMGDDRTTSCGRGPTQLGPLKSGPAIIAAAATGYAMGHRKIELTGEPEEVTIPLTRGGTLRIEDDAGVALTDFYPSLIDYDDPWTGTAARNEVLIRHTPAGRLKVSIGGGDSGRPLEAVDVDLPEGGEAIAPFS